MTRGIRNFFGRARNKRSYNIGAVKADADHATNRVINYFGGNSYEDLYNTLAGNIENDSYRENSLHMIQRYIMYKQQQERDGNNISFSQACNEYADQILNNNFKKRLKRSILAVPGYAASSAIALTGVGAIPAFAMSGTTTLALGSAEATLKRNVAAVGHGQEHIAESARDTAKNIFLQNQRLLKPEAKKKLEDLFGIENRTGFWANLVRRASYVSGTVISGTRTVINRIKDYAPTSLFNTIFGIVLPVMPVVNTGVAYAGAKLRHRSIRQDFAKFEEAVTELFNPQNYRQPQNVNFSELANSFSRSIKEPHCKYRGYMISGDYRTNIKKVVALPNWIGSKFPTVPGVEPIADLTQAPDGFDISTESNHSSVSIEQVLDIDSHPQYVTQRPNPVVRLGNNNELNYLTNLYVSGMSIDDVQKKIISENLQFKFEDVLNNVGNIYAMIRSANEKSRQTSDFEGLSAGIGATTESPAFYDERLRCWVFTVEDIADNSPAHFAGLRIGSQITIPGENSPESLAAIVMDIQDNGLYGIPPALIDNSGPGPKLCDFSTHARFVDQQNYTYSGLSHQQY